MKIGNLDFGRYPLFLAPMEDVTDESFRLMCKEFGADMVYTEFVSSDALVRNINSTTRKLNIHDEERPVAIQIYGRFVDAMVEAARMCDRAYSAPKASASPFCARKSSCAGVFSIPMPPFSVFKPFHPNRRRRTADRCKREGIFF